MDYLSKPVVLEELMLLLERAAGRERLAGALGYYRGREAAASGLARLLGESAPMRALRADVARLIESDRRIGVGVPPSVLVTGETGTGKELVARALHFDGPRSEAPFIEVNCAAIPSHLVESELFGHERGAFTDARSRKLGLAEAAHGGTLFLDEVGDLEPPVQAKLLKLLEDRRVRRVGGLRETEVDARIVAATNQPLEQLVREGRFRSDLYYRLRVVELVAPPLRARGRDALLLAEHFLDVHRRRYGRQPIALDAEARRMVLAHRWPGNVRELRNLMEQAQLLAPGDTVEARHLPLVAPPGSSPAAMEAFRLPEDGLDLGQIEDSLIRQALARTGGNVTRAAPLLGLSRDKLRYRMDKHGIVLNGQPEAG
jgi:DNA-binding NtrC family response regulator